LPFLVNNLCRGSHSLNTVHQLYSSWFFWQIIPLVPQLVPVFAKAVESNDTPQDVKIGIGRAVMQLCAQYGDQMQSVLGSLPPDEATALSSVMKQ
jgi:hypothetical protein